MWKFLIDIYITQPKAKNKKRFIGFYGLLIMSSLFTLLSINNYLYPVPELSELSQVEGTLVKVDDHAGGGRYPRVIATVLTTDNQQVEFIVSTSSDDASFYQQKIGSSIYVWYRWRVRVHSAKQIAINGRIIRSYSKETELKNYHFMLIFLYPILFMWGWAILKPWVLVISHQFKKLFL